LNANPIVATMIGDPCGIGPEIVVKALAEEAGAVRHLLVGDARVVANAVALTKAPFVVRAVREPEQAIYEPGCLDVLDPGALDPRAITVGQVSAACGRAASQWWDIACSLARDGRVAAVVKAPVNSEAIRLAGVANESLRRWGVAAPRIGVAGLNPHAYGVEEKQAIAPAIEAARFAGIDADGPVPPDSLFRLCTEGVYDCVIAHYHDQGHIAVKTWRFEGNCAVMLGEPYLRISVAHGTAFDIAGQGRADHRSMACAIRTASALAAGQGFPAV